MCIKRADRPNEKIFENWAIKESILKANGKGLSIALSEIHNYCYVIENGRIAQQGPAQDLEKDPKIRETHLGI
jgi:phosphopantetheinyl transferase